MKNIIQAYVAQHKERFIEELMAWLRIPSISADPNCQSAMYQAASFVVQQLQSIGINEVEICETLGHPIVFAKKIIDPQLPTILVYGHYDVQPPDPLEFWETPPFEPSIREGKLYARGACDDKGQVYMHIKALELMLKENILPCNVKLLIEGEEEIGSVNLENFVRQNQEKLKADVVLISDTSMLSLDTPSIDIGLRGLAYLQVEVTGPNRDLHSGVYGGAVANPITILCQMIAQLHDENQHITISNFYKQVAVVEDQQREMLNQAPFDDEKYKQDLGIESLWGEEGYTTLERVGIRPTLEVNGIWGGYTGEGAKTVLPSKAFAKISMRLVPNQTSSEIAQLFALHFKQLAPSGVTVKVTELHGGEPAVISMKEIAYLAAEQAIQDTLGKRPIPVRGGGSIPIVALFKKELQTPVVLLGFGLDSDNLHSPNEKFDLANFYKGIETIPLFYQYYMQMR